LQLAGEDDELTTVAPLRALISDFAALLAIPADAAATTRIERVPAIGRPQGRLEWIAMLERGSASLWHPANPAQNREWSEHRATSAAAVRRRINCHRNPRNLPR
jgi:hypothetical protein